MSSVNQILQEIARSESFEKLASFRDMAVWQSFVDPDRELLASLFVTYGETLLTTGEEAALEAFAAASDIAPQSTTLHWRQACLLAAVPACLHHAHEAFERAFRHWAPSETANKGELLWQWGRCWLAIGKASGEACDYRFAYEKMCQAEAEGVDQSAFWTDFGDALAQLGFLIHHKESLQQAQLHLQKAIKLNPDCFVTWLIFAQLGQRLYAITGERHTYVEAERAFRQAVGMCEDNKDLWQSWAQLCLNYGKLHRDLEVLRTALDKFEKANALVAEDHLLIAWAEAQMLVGSYTERLDLMREAQRKSQSCLDLFPENPRVWVLYGNSLNELGRYFHEDDYHLQAMETFKRGLALQQQDALLWYGYAQSHFFLGELRRDQNLIETAVRSYCKVVELGCEGIPQFYNDWGVALMKLGEMSNEKTYIEAAVDKFEMAIAYQMKGMESEGPEREGLDVEWLYNYGCSLDFLGDFTDEPQHYEKAAQILSQVIILDPEFSHARYNLALVFSHLGELTSDIDCLYKAVELFQTVIEQDGEDEAAWTDWGLALINLSQLMREPSRPDYAGSLLEQAEGRLLQAAALGSTLAFYPLACVYSLLGNHRAALSYMERAQAADVLPSSEELSQDEWLEGFRQTDEFRAFIHQLTAKNRDDEG